MLNHVHLFPESNLARMFTRPGMERDADHPDPDGDDGDAWDEGEEDPVLDTEPTEPNEDWGCSSNMVPQPQWSQIRS